MKKLEIKAPFITATFEPKNLTEKGTSNLVRYENRLQSAGDSFTGRKKELELLNNAIEKSDVLWLSGIMGIGKSTLASKIIVIINCFAETPICCVRVTIVRTIYSIFGKIVNNHLIL